MTTRLDTVTVRQADGVRLVELPRRDGTPGLWHVIRPEPRPELGEVARWLFQLHGGDEQVQVSLVLGGRWDCTAAEGEAFVEAARGLWRIEND